MRLYIIFLITCASLLAQGNTGTELSCKCDENEKYFMLPKDKWEEHSLNNGNFSSDRNIFGGTIYVKRLRPNNTTF